MTARARPRPRTARPARPVRPRRGTPFFKQHGLQSKQARWLSLGAVALILLIVFVTVDVPSLLADVRDGLLRAFGIGLLVIAAWCVAYVVAVRKQTLRDRKVFLRKAAGAAAAGLFAWGLFGLNFPQWSIGSVEFAESSLGGRLGAWLVGGVLAKMAWLSLFVIAMVLLAPRLSRRIADNVPYGFQQAWERRWPHRAARGVGNFLVVAFTPPRRDDDLAIDERTLRGRLDPYAAPSEEEPAVFRPSIDPAAPTVPPPMVAPARPEIVERGPAVTAEDDVDESAEPQQLGFAMGKQGWQFPAIEILNAPQPSTTRKHDNAARAQLIVDTLASFGVDATVVEINEGPTVTQFGVEPGWEVRYRDLQLRDEAGRTLLAGNGRARTERVEVGRTRVRVNKITALQNDLALALAAPSLRIEAPVPGRAIVGIEVPNDSATVVTLRSVMETREFADSLRKSKLTLALGRGVSGVPVVADLGKMPHLLIAGATGSGKSVCINTIVAGIMMNASPDEVRFVMIDPKRVEMTAYHKIPHLAFSEVIVDMDKVVGTLQAVVSEMEARYKKFAAVAVRNVESYNRHPRVLKKLAYWVVIIDELADLMMAAPFEVEKLICRLAQLARATGIHLVVATQRPSVDVVTGLIKANFPTRIAFAVTSMTDSRTILDMGGAEKLLGRGDMLYMPTDAAKPTRIQGVYLSDHEVERLVEFWTDDRFSGLSPENADDLLQQALVERNGGDEDIDVDDEDPVIERARELTQQHRHVSPSLFQRRLRVGYVKASKIMEILEEEGIVGPRDEGESRRVLQRTSAGEAN